MRTVGTFTKHLHNILKDKDLKPVRMTLEQETEDFKTYLVFLRLININYPVSDIDRVKLEERVKQEYKLIQKKESNLPARFRAVVVRIVKMHEVKETGGDLSIEC